MGLRCVEIAVGDSAIEGRLESALEQVGSRDGEDWTVRLESRGGAWALAVEGPRLLRTAPGWRTSFGAQSVSYRRRLESDAERTPGFLGTVVRRLVWEPIEFRENLIEHLDADLGRAFEQAVLQSLRPEPPQPLLVRFGVWRGEEDGLRYVCRVEGAVAVSLSPEPSWRWWSPLVRTPDELATFLREALRARGQRREAKEEKAVAPPRTRRQEFWGWGAAGQATL